MHKLLLCLLGCILANGQDHRWVNNYDDPLVFNCPNKDTISYITSQHNDYYEDRLWEFKCKSTFDTDPDCHWTRYINDFDKELNYQCPSHYVIAGMNSYHDDYFEDRRWKFYCCRVNNVCNDHCQWTSYVNSFDEKFSWEAPYQRYLTGVASYHDDYYEDRRWKYYYCARLNCTQ